MAAAPLRLGLVEGYKCVPGIFEYDPHDLMLPVHGVMAIPLPAGSTPGCLHINGAINWSAFRFSSDSPTNALRYLFQYISLVLEDRTLGTPDLTDSIIEDDQLTSLEDLEKKMTFKGRVLPSVFRNPANARLGSSIFNVHAGLRLQDYYNAGEVMPQTDPHRTFRSSLPTAEPVANARGPRISVVDPVDRPAGNQNHPNPAVGMLIFFFQSIILCALFCRLDLHICSTRTATL